MRKDPGHADGTGQEGHRQREQAHSRGHGGEPERDRQEERDDEEEAGLQQELEEERGQPGLEAADPEHPGVDQGGPVVPELSALPQHEEDEDDPAPEEQPDDGRRAQPLRRVGFGLHEAPRARADHAVDDHAEAGGGEQGADRIEADPGTAGESAIRRVRARMPITMRTSPTKTQRQLA